MLGSAGHAFLEGLLHRARSAVVQERLALSPRFLGAVDGLEAAGYLSAADAVEWRDRWAAAISTGPPPSSLAATRRAEPASAATGRGVADRLPAFTGAQLLRVVAASAREFSELPSLLGADLYTDGVVVRWVVAAPEPGRVPELRVRVTDDLGTEYRMFAGGGHRRGMHVHQEMALVPAVPHQANVLSVDLAIGDRLGLALA